MPTAVEYFYFVLILLAVGAIGSFVGGLFGVGGSVVLVPVLLTIFPFLHVAHEAVMHTAVGTSLALLIPNAFLAARQQYKMGNFDFPLLKKWIPFVLIGAIIGVSIIKFIPTTYLKILFSFYLYISFFYLLLKKERGDVLMGQPRGWGMRISGILIGGFSVLLGISGGAFSVSLCQFYNYPLKKSIAFASTTSIFIGCIGTIGVIISGIGAPDRAPYSLGFVNLLAFVSVFPTIVVFSPLGVKIANRLSIKHLKRAYSTFLLIMALYMTSHIFIKY